MSSLYQSTYSKLPDLETGPENLPRYQTIYLVSLVSYRALSEYTHTLYTDLDLQGMPG